MTVIANPNRNEVVIKLGSKEYLAKASFNFISQMEAYFDLPFIKIANKVPTFDMKQSDVPAIIVAGIRAAGGTVDQNEIEEAVVEVGFLESIGAISDLLAIGFTGPALNRTDDKKK